MTKQNYENHVRYYIPHHFIFYPLLLALVVFSAYNIYEHPAAGAEWKVITAALVFIGWLSFMTRQHYALTLQNRVVRMEMRLRYFELTGLRLEPLEEQLTTGQLAALRFASDEELPDLMQRAVNEKLTPKQIKMSIRKWIPEYMRV